MQKVYVMEKGGMVRVYSSAKKALEAVKKIYGDVRPYLNIVDNNGRDSGQAYKNAQDKLKTTGFVRFYSENDRDSILISAESVL